MLITKVMNPCLNPVTLCNRRYTWAEESLSTWNLQRMKTTFSKRYKTTISSGYLHLQHSKIQNVLTQCLAHAKHHGEYKHTHHLHGAHYQMGDKHGKFCSCVTLSATISTKDNKCYMLWEGWYFKTERAISDQRLHWQLRFGRSLTVAQSKENRERNFRWEEKGIKEVSKTLILQVWETCRTTDRNTL